MSQFWEYRLAHIREQLLLMSGLTERNLAQAIRGLAQRDDRICDAVEASDSEVDKLEVHIDDLVATYMATHAPTAGDCRMMLAASKISTNLERIADEATKIARRARDLNSLPALQLATEIPAMGAIAQEMLRHSMTAFLDGDDTLALSIIARDHSVDSINKQLERELIQGMREKPKSVTAALHLLTVARAIERVADHAANIAEEVFFFYKGQDIRHEPSLKGSPPNLESSKQNRASRVEDGNVSHS